MQVIFAPDCREAFERAGLDYPEREPEPGRLCRFPTNGRKDDAAGWLRIFPDQDGAAFGNWRDGSAFTWQRQKDGPPPNPAELAAIRARAEEARKQAEAEREEGYREGARKAAATWQAAAPALIRLLTVRSMLNNGVTSEICGNIAISNDRPTSSRLPGKSSRATA